MKYLLTLSCILLQMFLYGQEVFGLMIDPRDGEKYRIKTFNRPIAFGVVVSQTWMIDNLRFKTDLGSYHHSDLKTDEERKRYGRLYTHSAARKACPVGWHLPSDLEWQILAHQFYKGLLIKNRVLYETLTTGGSSGFEALLGGVRFADGTFTELESLGSYWSNTAEDFEGIFTFDFKKKNFIRFTENLGPGDYALSCRCIKD